MLPSSLLAEDRDPGLVAGHETAARALKAHLGGEGRACRRVDGEAPAASARELLLCRWAVGRDERERRAVLQMVGDTVEIVGPHRAVGAAGAHVVDQDQVLLLSEQRGQADGAVGALQLVVADRLVGQPAPQVGQFLLRLFEFLVGGREFLIELGVGMGHRFLLAKNRLCLSSSQFTISYDSLPVSGPTVVRQKQAPQPSAHVQPPLTLRNWSDRRQLQLACRQNRTLLRQNPINHTPICGAGRAEIRHHTDPAITGFAELPVVYRYSR